MRDVTSITVYVNHKAALWVEYDKQYQYLIAPVRLSFKLQIPIVNLPLDLIILIRLIHLKKIPPQSFLFYMFSI